MPQKDLIIKNAAVYDPGNGINGDVADILISRGAVSDKVDERRAEVIDAKDMVAMPAGVDIHSHIAGSKLAAARKSGNFPSIQETGRLYAKMGYLQVTEPAMHPKEATQVHKELAQTPFIDKATLLLTGNDEKTLKYAAGEDTAGLAAHLSQKLTDAKAYGVKATDPGGAAALLSGKEIRSLSDTIPGYEMTQGEVVSALIKACVLLKLPHPLHLHISALGLPGNYENALAALKYSPMHLAHLQFYSYGGSDWKTFRSEAETIAAEANKRSGITFDIGQVMFGDSVTVTADEALERRLAKMGGSGHYTYKTDSGVNSVQWAAGLELALHTKDPWKAFISTDSPNGGPFTSYPKIIAWLMDKKYRDQQLKACHSWASQRTTLPSIERELTLEEIVVMTRAGPAKRLGLQSSLSVGAKANTALYQLNPGEGSGKEVEAAFSSAAYVIKEGEIVVKDGETIKEAAGSIISWKQAGP